jgi:hypothetical protein
VTLWSRPKSSRFCDNLVAMIALQRSWRLGRQWAIWGTVATLLPLANLYFMVFKP